MELKDVVWAYLKNPRDRRTYPSSCNGWASGPEPRYGAGKFLTHIRGTITCGSLQQSDTPSPGFVLRLGIT